MKILLLGAGGFIGANLTERLVGDGQHEITALDIEREKLDETVKSGDIHFIHFDIRANEKELERLTAEHDVVIDLVAMANPSLYVSNPIDVFKLNFSENLKIAEFCVKHKKRIVQFSTCEVYGITAAKAFGRDSSKHPTPFAEDETPLIMGPIKNHRWIYACAKQLLERVLHAYGLEEGLNYTIIRPFNFIGPRIDYLPSEQTGNPRVFSHFMNALLYGTPIKLVDGGVNYR
ncbi:MAG: NAD-dependent epimerase/dehydratase family protein, partial [Terrimicrobiaceae bacterium]